MLLSTPRFPILTLDEAKLTPALGYLFHRKWIDPYESLVSILEIREGKFVVGEGACAFDGTGHRPL